MNSPPHQRPSHHDSHTPQDVIFGPGSPLVETIIGQDLEYESIVWHSRSSPSPNSSQDAEWLNDHPGNHSMAESYRRPSFIASGPRSTVVAALSLPDHGYLSRRERDAIRDEERGLLRDSNCLPRERIDRDARGLTIGKRLSLPGLRKARSHQDEESRPGMLRTGSGRGVSETSPLLTGSVVTDHEQQTSNEEDIDKKWEEAVVAGKIKTTWQREVKVLGRYSSPLVLTFILQYSLTVASIFAVGHIGKAELGAVSLASMTANITGYAVYQGLATSLDTLCAQAYGSGRKKLVGLQLQRMVYFLWLITIPIGIIWLSGTAILRAIVPEKDTAALAGLYLKIILLGAPGYAAFESGKRFVQAQGLFSATLYCLLVCAPLNALMNWLFVWQFNLGFVGAPIAVTITENLLPLCLFLYVRFVDGMQCWGGFERRAFKNWGPMIKLALPGLVMVLAEFLAFEILTLSASWLSATHLAAQSVLSTLTALTFQIPFPVSIAASTRVANLIGATLSDAAKTAAKVALIAACFIGAFNITLLSSLREYIPKLFTSETDVIQMVACVLPLCAAFQLFDALATNCNGILRGLGRQEIGGYVNLFAYYVIAIPISFGTGFGLHWGLYGLWAGPAVALGIVASVEGIFIYRVSWERAVAEAQTRNSMG
ncbi:multidrug and toxin extrusion protein [Lineolata rhizophorae]|uniref:Multidrug and toxin extrusion protein n=1 Tax=Lineolata rhizophorae TaxID=578093 RepID=A0A6A6P5N1_9PEZI|nr:multidrug and toxin extrusion protein [Lineolata rhizophorae]